MESMSPGGVTVSVNDQPRVLGGAATLSALVDDLGLGERSGIAVAVNGSVVPRAAWVARDLRDGDRVIVIEATQGG